MDTINFGELTFRFSSLDSTMNFGRTLARLGFPEGTAVLADEQTAGRGTKGRWWHSSAKKGLYVSFLLRPPAGLLHLLPLAAGLAAAEAVEELARVDMSLKWPNDLLFRGKKIGGILCEAETSTTGQADVIAGFGLNLNHHREDFAEEVADLATSLLIITGQTYQPEQLFQLLGRKFQFWYNKLKEGQAKLIVGRFEARLSFSPGQTVIIKDREGKVSGQFGGLAQDGSLILQIGQENKKYYASEIVRVLS
ncbi:MAG TPA: biotin--[acetyl-CoA-carboxylase] ligase [Candidatus Saccharicenans sp.]|jgi:BirA family biotin operon repressor/biotin-[acetyl-CoA-carboxylase] ligase|nr:biotin--[acetyl-CoA-carboxylase] ligase [Candidatus Saccharicenans sp.]